MYACIGGLVVVMSLFIFNITNHQTLADGDQIVSVSKVEPKMNEMYIDVDLPKYKSLSGWYSDGANNDPTVMQLQLYTIIDLTMNNHCSISLGEIPPEVRKTEVIDEEFNVIKFTGYQAKAIINFLCATRPNVVQMAHAFNKVSPVEKSMDFVYNRMVFYSWKQTTEKG